MTETSGTMAPNLVFGGLSGVHFADPEQERRFRRFGVEQSVVQEHQVAWIAAAMFVISTPLDILFIGGGAMTPQLVVALLVRAAIVAICGACGLYVRKLARTGAPAELRGQMLIAGWLLSIAALWVLIALAHPPYAAVYIACLGLASLATTSLIPSLYFREIRALNTVILLPIAYAMIAAAPFETTTELGYLVTAIFLAVSMVAFGLNSKWSYELAQREAFVQNRQLVEARDAAQRADQAKSVFLATVSHELRTPLNAILGNIRLATRTADLPDKAADMLAEAERAGRTVTQLIEDVLQISSMDVRRTSTDRQPFRLGDLIADLEATIGVLASEKGLRLELPADKAREQWLSADESCLRQILLNLMGNAVKFTREGRVGLRLGIGRGRVRFVVFDTGIGLPRDQVPNAFKPFFRGSNVASVEFRGTGLGLALVQNMVDRLGGHIALKSRLGEGTVAAGWIPANSVETPCQSAADTAGVLSAGAPLKVLVVEDEPVNMAILRRLLELDSHLAFEATSGAHALEIFRHQPVDCVLTDIRLPDMTGVELSKALTHAGTENAAGIVPIYAVTANVLADDLIRYERAGFDGVIPKPIEEPVLYGALRDVAKLQTARDVAEPAPTQTQDPRRRLTSNWELERFYRNSKTDCARGIQAAINSGDLKELKHFVHRLRGAAASYGDKKLSINAEKIEQSIRNGRTLTPIVVAKIERFLTEIREHAD